MTYVSSQYAEIFRGCAALLTLTGCAPPQGDGIVDIASGEPDFSILVAALPAAGLVDTRKALRPVHRFCANNAAFAALPAGTPVTLLAPKNRDTLVSILTYHVVPGQITSGDVLGTRRSVATVNGATVDVNGIVGKLCSRVKVNDGSVIQADIFAANGVIHAIDKVLLP